MAKKALVFGLGLLGGGVATTNWLIKHGWEVTVTDIKNKKQLASSLRKIKGVVKLALGGHSKDLIRGNDLIVVNPDVSINNPFLQLAKKLNKDIENEATIFYKHWPKKIIGVTGTRGKTTTVNWINHFLNTKFRSVVAGNHYSRPLLAILDKAKRYDWAVTELPSFLLELFNNASVKPDVAVITNLYQDHLNRHRTLAAYAKIKANIFNSQTAIQHLILNFDNKWTKFFLKEKPKSKIWFFSVKTIGKKTDGVFYRSGNIYFQIKGKTKKVLEIPDFVKEHGEHNLGNLLVSSLTVNLAGISWQSIQKSITSLPEIEFREEVIFENKKLKIINDTTATSPDGAIAAMKRFSGASTILIAGGTDRELDFNDWAKTLPKYLKLNNVIFLSGSATNKMLTALKLQSNQANVCQTLKNCLEVALVKAKKYNKSLVLFSPGAKSFEKFKNEYDRGKQFDNLVRRLANG